MTLQHEAESEPISEIKKATDQVCWCMKHEVRRRYCYYYYVCVGAHHVRRGMNVRAGSMHKQREE